MPVTQNLIEFVKGQEGFAPTARWDYQQYTNGFGTKALTPLEHITEQEANVRLIRELGLAMASVEKIAPEAPQGVKDALADLTFNEGTEWEHDNLGRYVKAGDWQNAKAHFLMYRMAGGKPLPGLEMRRAKAAAWFPAPAATVVPTAAEKPVDEPKPAPAPVAPPVPTAAPEAPETPLAKMLHTIETLL